MSLKRIEDAIERLEAAAQQPSPRVAQLRATNDRLRETIVNSLSRIDAVIAEHGAEPQS